MYNGFSGSPNPLEKNRGKNMPQKTKRISFLVSADMEAGLASAQQEAYRGSTMNEMLRALISRGLMTVKPEKETLDGKG